MRRASCGVDNVNHDCPTCVRLIEKFGTCEYMHQANAVMCTCKLYQKKQSRNEQQVLQTDSTQGARLRYWRDWLRNQKWVLDRDAQAAPNLSKTDDSRIEDFSQNSDTITG